MSTLKMFASSFLAVALMSAAPAMACPEHEKTAKAEDKPAPTNAQVTTAVFRVEGMHCAGCADHVKEALAKAGGVVKVEVKTADKKVMVTFEPSKITAEKIAKMISDAGYPASAEV